ncbi:hypothetical protein TRIP_D440389 [uncultured Paludibacter sp.]|uniref:Uncharacterized protein n=1 Tax=uncultured Paludibacter sp. TaxID=497635 RepID=A0A653AKF3_9BACT|nr:hypothetical protein TRIP_D440389 [uncultured Paludibacter sp.]
MAISFTVFDSSGRKIFSEKSNNREYQEYLDITIIDIIRFELEFGNKMFKIVL